MNQAMNDIKKKEREKKYTLGVSDVVLSASFRECASESMEAHYSWFNKLGEWKYKNMHISWQCSEVQ